MTHKNEAAFPIAEQINVHGNTVMYAEIGLTKREWFAGMALQGLCNSGHVERWGTESVARSAFCIADEIISLGKLK